MTNYVWWLVESYSIPDLSDLSPMQLSIDQLQRSFTDTKRYSLRFSTKVFAGEISVFYHELFKRKGVLAKSWPNECMFYPANLGYPMTEAGFARFVQTYQLTYANQVLIEE